MKTKITKNQLIQLLNELGYQNKLFYYQKYDFNNNSSKRYRCKNHNTLLNEIDTLHKIDLYHFNKNNVMYAFIYCSSQTDDKANISQLIRLSIRPKDK